MQVAPALPRRPRANAPSRPLNASSARNLAPLEPLESRLFLSAGHDPRLFAPNAHPYGQSYGEWVASFWQYALEHPVGGHPFLDTPQYDFASGQSGKVWFWSAPDGPITREVTIPKSTALFLTVRDVEVSSLETPPFFGATEEEQREQANWFADHIVDVSVSIDGVPVKDADAYRFDSPQFEFQAPTPWIFGDTGGAGTAVGDGYYMMIKPLPVGTHTIEYSGTFHFDAGELADEPLDLPHSGTIILKVVKEKKPASAGKKGQAGPGAPAAAATAATPTSETASVARPVSPSLFGSTRIAQPRRSTNDLLTAL